MKPKVLLIDDEELYADVMRDVLVNLGFEVIMAFNAMEAMDHLHHGLPDLILLDVMMPVIDGLMLLRWLKASPDRKMIPIYVVSAKTTAGDRNAAFSAGADAFLAKPFTFRELKKLVSAHLPPAVAETPPKSRLLQ